MPKLNIGEAIGLVLQTMPFLMLRGALYLAFGIFVVVYFLFVWVLAKLFGNGAAGLVFLIATVGLWPIIKLFKYFALYFLQAAHIAVLSQLIKEGQLPQGVAQVEFGKSLVVSKFKEVSVLFAVNEIVNAILKSFNRTVVNLGSFTGISAFRGLAQLINLIIGFSISLVDEAILSFILIHKEENYWKGAKDGLILYVQSWKAILFNSAVMGLINAVSFAVLFCVFIALLTVFFPSQQTIALIGALVMAYLVKEAFVYPVAMAAIIITFHKEADGKSPDAVWEERLDSASNKFRELKQKAIDFVSPPKPASS